MQITQPDGSVVVIKTTARRKGKKNRKHGRNFRWEGTTHSLTKYRMSGNREKNKARRAAQRSRKLQRLKDLRNAVHFKEHGSEEAESDTKGSGSSQR